MNSNMIWWAFMVARAAAVPKQKSLCGSQSATLYANATIAMSPMHYPSQGAQYNAVQYYQWPNITSWPQCKLACVKTSGCQSFQYGFDGGDEEDGPGIFCNLLFKHTNTFVTKVKSSKGGNANTYFDVDCPNPKLEYSGTVNPDPNTKFVQNNTCPGVLQWNGNQTQFIADGLRGILGNASQIECGHACNTTSTCKSYLWSAYNSGYIQPRYQSQVVYAPSDPNTGNTAATCLLLTQPVKGYTEPFTSDDLDTDFFWDKRCPYNPELDNFP